MPAGVYPEKLGSDWKVGSVTVGIGGGLSLTFCVFVCLCCKKTAHNKKELEKDMEIQLDDTQASDTTVTQPTQTLTPRIIAPSTQEEAEKIKRIVAGEKKEKRDPLYKTLNIPSDWSSGSSGKEEKAPEMKVMKKSFRGDQLSESKSETLLGENGLHSANLRPSMKEKVVPKPVPPREFKIPVFPNYSLYQNKMEFSTTTNSQQSQRKDKPHGSIMMFNK